MINSDIQSAFDFISNFTEVTDNEKNIMVNLVHLSYHKKNDLLLQHGQIPKRAAFVLEGGIRSYYIDEKGVEHTTSFIFENHPFVFLDSFTEQTSVAVNSVALESTKLVWAGHHDFFQFLENFPKYEVVLRTVLSRYMAKMSEQTNLLRILSSSERYKALCEMRPDIIQRVPLKYIASYLEMTPETLSRVRAGKL